MLGVWPSPNYHWRWHQCQKQQIPLPLSIATAKQDEFYEGGCSIFCHPLDMHVWFSLQPAINSSSSLADQPENAFHHQELPPQNNNKQGDESFESGYGSPMFTSGVPKHFVIATLLAQCGDIESNPGPKPKKGAAEPKPDPQKIMEEKVGCFIELLSEQNLYCLHGLIFQMFHFHHFFLLVQVSKTSKSWHLKLSETKCVGILLSNKQKMQCFSINYAFILPLPCRYLNLEMILNI